MSAKRVKMDFGDLPSGGMSELSQVFIGYHPHNSNTGYKNWEYCQTENRDLVSYASGTITILKDFEGFMYFNSDGGDTFDLEVNGNSIATAKYESLYSFKAGDTIKHKRTSSNKEYRAFISIVSAI